MRRGAARRDPGSIIQRTFARQARGFATSPVHNDPRRLRSLIEFAGAASGSLALDVACGPGIVTAALRSTGVEVVGVDLTADMVRLAAARGGMYVQGEAGRLPFRDGIFDLVLTRNSLHHIAEASRVVREMVRVIRPGGRLVIEDMRAPDDPAQREYQTAIERLRDPSHARALTRDEIRVLAREAGLPPGEDRPLGFEIDFDEWVDRACESPGDRRKARRMLERCLEADLCGLRVWREGGRLKFERQSLLFRATRPAP